MRRPDFFLVGAPRCGTTAMNAYLKRHPQIFMARKESHFFAVDLQGEGFVRDEDAYRELFREAQDEKRVGEASVLYLLSVTAAQRIKAFAPRARILAMLRNPVDMLYSLHQHNVSNGVENILDFEQALAAEADRRQGKSLPLTVHSPHALLYSEMVRYADQLGRYYKAFGRTRVKVVIYDDFRRSPERVYRDVLEFLDVDVGFRPPFETVNANRHPRSLTLQRVLTALADRIAAMPPFLRPVLESGRNTLLRANTRLAPRSPMDPALRQRLQERFAPNVEELSRLLDRDLALWTKPGR